jgi:hypothetical protein
MSKRNINNENRLLNLTNATLTTPTITGGTVTNASVVTPTITSGGNAWTKNCCQIYEAGTQSINNNVTTSLNFGSTRYDYQGGMSDAGNDRIIIPEDGIYHILVHVQSAASASGVRQLYIQINGTLLALNKTYLSSTSTWMDAHHIGPLTAGQKVTAALYQNSGASMTIGHASSESQQCRLIVAMLSDAT